MPAWTLLAPLVMFGVGVAGLAGIRALARRPPSSLAHPQLGAVTFREITSPADLPGSWRVDGPMGPFAHDLALRTLDGGGSVVVAVVGDAVIGVVLRCRAPFVDSCFATDPLLQASLVRHHPGEAWVTDCRVDDAGGEPVFLVEEWRIVALDGPSPVPVADGPVRAMTDDDRAGLLDLFARAAPEQTAGWLDVQLRRGDRVQVAVVDGRPAGVGFGWVEGGEGRIHGVLVDPAARGHGLGGHLLRAILADLAGRGATRVTWEVGEGTPAYLNYAHRLGFAEVARMWVQSRDATLHALPRPSR